MCIMCLVILVFDVLDPHWIHIDPDLPRDRHGLESQQGNGVLLSRLLPHMDSIHRGNEENEGNVYRMPTLPTFKTAMTATWKYSNFLLKPLESNRIQIEDGKNWFTIWDFLFKHGFLMNFLSPFCLNKTSKIYQNL